MIETKAVYVQTAIRFFCSWSGGKGSCLSLYKMINSGHACASLLTLTNHSSSAWMPPIEAVQAQSAAMGLPLLVVHSDYHNYRERFQQTSRLLSRQSITHVVFGDTWLVEQREWIESVCVESGLVAHFPLYRRHHGELARNVVNAGFKLKVVATDPVRVPTRFLGREFDSSLIEEFEMLGIDPCGESGEFYTFAYDGPLFRHPIGIELANSASNDRYRYLPITTYQSARSIS